MYSVLITSQAIQNKSINHFRHQFTPNSMQIYEKCSYPSPPTSIQPRIRHISGQLRLYGNAKLNQAQQFTKKLQLRTHLLLIMNLSKQHQQLIFRELENRMDEVQSLEVVHQESDKHANIIITFKTNLISQQIQTYLTEKLLFFVLYIHKIVLIQQKKFNPQDEAKDKSYLKIVKSIQEEHYFLELPACCFCLDKLEPDISGITHHHPISQKLLQCSVCTKIQGYNKQKNSTGSQCLRCESRQDNWICLICSKIGCGRYKNADAFKHYENTCHSLVLDLQFERIWNYQLDCFSHRLTKHKQPLKIGSQYVENDVNAEESLELSFWQYCSSLSEELEKQRKFYQKIEKQETTKWQNEKDQLKNSQIEIQKQIDLKSQLAKKLQKKSKKNEKRLDELKQKCQQNRQILAHYDQILKEEPLAEPETQQANESEEITNRRKMIENLELEIEEVLVKLSS